ncbi:DUF2510 domain-containing protein, partial [Mycobacterium sp.]|uniref:DUF2510 domain-containing protein n=1 Tax=Mycobacterium sp. TaxID=1785 RepID=UPI002D7F0621
MTTPQGWYPDPQSAGMLRYWDGRQWTSNTSRLGAAAKPDLGSMQARKVATFGSRQDRAEVPPSQRRGASLTYDAFLSYSRDDEAVAAGIQKGLHHVGRRVGQLNALRVFRDTTDLGANPNLLGKVTDAMDRSRYLIVVLSPHAAASPWVNKEVTHWLARREPEQLMFVLADGHLYWDEATQRFDPDRSDAAPPVLTKDKEPGVLPTEPLYVDVRGLAPWDPHAPTFRDKVTDLAAPIHGKSKYELASDDVREQRRFRRLRRAAIAGLAVLTISALTAATIALFQWREARHQKEQALMQRNQAVALRLSSQGESMLAGTRGGGDVQALQQILAVPRIARGADAGALFTGVSERRDTIKIIPTADDTVNAMALSPNGRHIIAGGNRKLQIWDTDTGQPIGAPLTGHSDSVFCVAYSPDGHRIASGGMDTTVRLWDADTGQPIGGPLTGHEGPVTSVAFSPDGGHIATGSWDNTVRLWDAHTGEPIGAPLAGEQSITRTVETVTFSPDGRRVASGSNDHTIQLWDVATGQPIGAPIAGHAGTVHSVVFSPDGRRIASGSDDATVRLWDAGTGQPIGAPLTGHTRGVFSVAFSPDGQRIVSGSGDHTLRLWDSATGRQIGTPLYGHTSIVQNVAFTPDGHRIVSGANDATLRVWDADIGTPITGDQGRVNAVAFSPDGQHIVTGNGDGTVRLADLGAGRRIGEPLTGRTQTVWTVAFSPDGRHIAAGSGNGLRLWDAPTGQLVRLPSGPGDFILSVA